MKPLNASYCFGFILYYLWASIGFAQSPTVTTHIDTLNIRIGEQIKYQISVDSDHSNVVQFPEGQTFSPMEMVKSSTIDTLKKGEYLRLLRTYYLTQFNAGTYTIPPQHVFIGQTMLTTDSVQVSVKDIVIDTLKQPLYGVKPMLDVPAPKTKNSIWFIILAICIGMFVAVYFLFLRKRKYSEQEQLKRLPPFERAVWQLTHLKNSRYLLESKHKQYYSELIDIIRLYLEKETHISTFGATSEELLEKIYSLKNQGVISISEQTEQLLKEILHRSDLVKFAQSKPSDNIAEEDRSTIEKIIKETRQSIIENTALEKDNSEQHTSKTPFWKTKKYIVISLIIILLLSTSIIGGYHIFSNPLKGLLQQEWFTSDYGYPSLRVSTPWVLKRKSLKTPSSANENIASMETFEAGSLNDGLKIVANIIVPKHNETQDNAANQNSVEKLYTILIEQELEGQQATDIITQNQDFTTEKNIKGVKISGSFQLLSKKCFYQLYIFNQNGAIEQLLIAYEKDNQYATEIAQRISKSIDIKTE